MKETTEETGVVVEEELLSNMIKTAKDLKTHFQSKGEPFAGRDHPVL